MRRQAFASLVALCFVAMASITFVSRAEPNNTKCIDTETRLSYSGFDHCRLHAQYQVAFRNWNCHCYSGQCRPTSFRKAPEGTESETGYQIMVNGGWYDIPKPAFRRERALMTENLLEYSAHVCSSNPPNPHIECAWVDLPG